MAIIYTSTADTIVANTTTETSLLPTALVVPVDTLKTQSSFRFTVRGLYSTTVSPPTLRLRVKCTSTSGTTVLGDSGAQSVTSLGNSRYFSIDSVFTVRTSGSPSSTEFAQGHAIVNTAAITGQIWELFTVSVGSFDSTVVNTFDITAQWGTASASNIITSTNVVIEVVTGV